MHIFTPLRHRVTWLLGTLLAFCWLASNAEAAYVQRFNTITTGAITFTGNTLGLAKGTSVNAPGTNGSIGTFTTIDTSLKDSTYPAGTTEDWTKNSSLAVLNIPAGSTVLYAELIWGGSYRWGTEDVFASLGTSVKLTRPNGTTTTVAPDPATANNLGSPIGSGCTASCFYTRSANVTSLIQAGGAGNYVVGGVPGTQATSENNSNAAGWTLAVVYEKSGSPARNLTLFTGAELINQTNQPQATVSGFCTPLSGVRKGRLMVTAIEGDAGLGGDRMRFGPTAATVTDISGPNNPVANFFASQINKDDGTLDTSGTFGTFNHNAASAAYTSGGRQGWDITNVDVSSTLGSGQTSAVAQGTSTGDQYTITALALQIDVGAPSFPTTVKTVDKANAVPGDVLTYTVRLDNRTGSADASNVIFTDTPPPGTSFVAGSLTVDGVTQVSANPVTGVNTGTIAAGQQKVVSFKVRVDSVPAAPNPASFRNTGSWTYQYVSCAGQPTQNAKLDTDEAVTLAPRLEPVKTVSPAGTVRPGDVLTYTISVPNTGLANSSGSTLQDAVPAGTTYIAGSTTLNNVPVADVSGTMPFVGARAISSPSRPAGQINAGETATIQFQVRINPSTLGTVTNTATIDQDGTGPLPAQTAQASNSIQPTADLSITKTSNPTTLVKGQPVTYTIEVVNNGPSSVTNAVIADTLPAGLDPGAQWTCNKSGLSTCGVIAGTGDINATVNLEPGAANKVVFTITAIVSPAGPASIINTATVAPPAGTFDPNANNNTASSESSASAIADLSLAKTVDNPSPAVGENVKFTITLTNAGPSVAGNVSVKDQLPSGLQFVSSNPSAGSYDNVTGIWTVGNVPVGSRTLEITAKVVQPGSITNRAEVSASSASDPDSTPNDGVGDDSASVGLTARAPDLTVTKTHTGTFLRGDTGTYTINVSNSGTASTVGQVRVDDALPAGLTPIAASGTGWTCSISGQVVSCTRNDSLAPAGTYPGISLTVRVAQNAAASITNTAAASGGGEFNTGNSSASDPTSIASSADVSVDKAGPAEIVPGTNAGFSITVANPGPSDATNVVVTDPTPAGLSFVSNTGACTTAFPCNLGTIPAGSSRTITVTYSVPANYVTGALGPDPVANTANVTTSTPDPDTTNNANTVSIPVVPSADLEITKVAPASVTPGSSATFTISVKNKGPSDAVGVSVTDPTPAGLTFVANAGACTTAFPCSLGTIPAGATRTIQTTYSIPATYTTPDPVSNTATATSTTPDPNGPNTSTATAPVRPSADLSLSKTVDDPTPNIGANIKYTLTLTNAGPSVANTISVRDALHAGLQFVSQTSSTGTYDQGTGVWTVPTLAIGTATLEITAKVTGSSAITNTAEVTASGTTDPDSTPNDGSGDDRASVGITPRLPDLTLEKTHKGSFVRGTSNAYSITVQNTGDGDTIAPVTVSDTLPVGLTPGSATGTGWTCSTTGQAVSCSRTTPADVLASGASFPPITVPVTVELTAASGTGNGNLTNTATAAGGGEVNTGNSSGSDPTDIVSSADVKISKSGPASAVAGTNVSYTITVRNDGPSNAVNVAVSDPTPSGLTFVSNAGACTTAFPCNLGTLAPNDVRTITATYAIPSGYTTPDPIANTATVTSDTPDPASGSNTATANTSLGAPIADLGLTKTDDPPSSTAIPGTPITYKIVVTNAGPSDANGARVVDNFPATITGVIWNCAATGGSSCPASGTGDINAVVDAKVGGTITFTATGTIAASALGNLVNTASVTPPAGTSDPSSNNNSDENTLVPQADLSVTKTGPASITPGTNVSYTITVKNDGPSNAASVEVVDPTPDGLTFVSNTGDCTTAFPCDLGVLAPGATRTITATYSVSADYTAPVPVKNTVTVSSATIDPGPGLNSAEATSTLSPSADLKLAKTVDKTAPVVGDTVKFTVTLTNAGPSDATGVTVTDQLPAGLAYLSHNASAGAYNPATGLWSLIRVATGTATLEVNARVTAVGSITNTAEVTASGTPDPNSTPGDGTGDDRASATLGAVAPDLTLTKTHTGSFVRGSSGTYSITATNSGSSPTSASVTVSDTLPVGLTPSGATGTGWTCSVSGQLVSCNRSDALAAGASYPVIQVAVSVDQGAASSLTNTASVSGGGDVDTTNNTASDPTAIGSSADLSLTKTVDKPAPNIGDTIKYTITLTNAGPSNAVNVSVTDQLPAGLSFVSSNPSEGSYASGTGVWSIANLPTGSATLEITAKVTGSGAISNVAEVTASGTPDPDSTPGDGAGDDRAGVTINATVPDLTVTKTHSGDFARGSSGLYTIIVRNSGTGATIAPVSMTDTLPAGLVPVSAVGTGWTCSIAGQDVGCTRNDVLAASSSYPAIFIGVNVAQTAAGGTGTGNLTNTANVTGGGELTTTNNAGSDPTNILSSADLTMSKSGPASITPGLPVKYTLRITNTGPSDAKGVTVNDPTPTGLTFVSNTGACTTAFPCALGDLGAGESREIEVTYSVPANYQRDNLGPDPVANTATVSSTTPDVNPNNSSATVFTPVTSSADLQLTKTGPAKVVAGTNVSFTLTVTNAGPSDATNVQLEDPTPEGLSFVSNTGDCTSAFPCDLGTVPVGATRTVTATYAIPATYTTPDPIRNVAKVNSSTPDPNPNNSVSVASSSIAAPIADLGISKTDGSTVAVPGQPIQYTITVTNAGPSAATNARVTDTLPTAIQGPVWTCVATGGSSCSSASGSGDLDSLITILPGDTVTFIVKGTVAPDAVGFLVNSAGVTPPVGTSDPTSANNTDVNTLVPSADLSLSKTGPAMVTPGLTAVYTITVRNAGPSNAANVVVNDPTPAGLVWLSSAGDCNTAFPCNLGTVAPNTTKTITATYRVPANYSGPATVTNTATVTSPTDDPDASNDAKTVTSSIAPSADLSVVKTVNNSKPLPGDAVTFSITAANAGPSDAVNVVVREQLPVGLALQTSSTTGGTYDTATGLWTIPTLPAGTSVKLSVVAIVTANGPIQNTAEVVSSGTPDPDSTPNDGRGDDVSSVTFGAPVADLSITKTNNATTSIPGSPVTYTITARNAGPDAALGANVADAFPSSITGVTWRCVASAGSSCPTSGTGDINATVNLEPNGIATFTATGTIAPGATGVLANTAKITPPFGINDPGQDDNVSTDTDALGPQADLEVSKTAPVTAIKGSKVNTLIVVKNNGPSNASSVVLTDPIPAGMTFFSSNASQGSCGFDAPSNTLRCELGTLASGLSASINLVTTATVIGVSTNTATASSNTPDPKPENNAGSASTNIGTLSDLKLEKTHEGIFIVGETGEYTLRVSNIGADADPGPFTLKDTLPDGLTYVSFKGTNWDCTSSQNVVTCTHPGPLAGGGEALEDLKLTVRVGQAAFPAVTNVAEITSPLGDSNPSNNTARDLTGVTAPVLALEKTALQPQVELGGTLGFELKVRNNGSVTISDVSIVDALPLGLTYRPSTSTLDGTRIPDPQITVKDGRQTLTWPITGTLAANATRTIRFNTIATPALPDKPIINTATAQGKAGPLSVVVASNTATANVKTTRGVFTNNGTILGRVYFDKNDNNSFEEGIDEPLEGARVYLSDGRYAITDKLGRYSFGELELGRYAVRLDPLTVPYTPKRLPDNQGLIGTRLVSIQNGISIEDFPLEWQKTAILKARATRVTRGPVTIVKQLEPGGAGYAVLVTINLSAPVANLTITDPLPADTTRGPIELRTVDGKTLEIKPNGERLTIPGTLEPGTHTLRFALFTPLPPEAVVTDPSIQYDEVIR